MMESSDRMDMVKTYRHSKETYAYPEYFGFNASEMPPFLPQRDQLPMSNTNATVPFKKIFPAQIGKGSSVLDVPFPKDYLSIRTTWSKTIASKSRDVRTKRFSYILNALVEPLVETSVVNYNETLMLKGVRNVKMGIAGGAALYKHFPGIPALMTDDYDIKTFNVYKSPSNEQIREELEKVANIPAYVNNPNLDMLYILNRQVSIDYANVLVNTLNNFITNDLLKSFIAEFKLRLTTPVEVYNKIVKMKESPLKEQYKAFLLESTQADQGTTVNTPFYLLVTGDYLVTIVYILELEEGGYSMHHLVDVNVARPWTLQSSKLVEPHWKDFIADPVARDILPDLDTFAPLSEYNGVPYTSLGYNLYDTQRMIDWSRKVKENDESHGRIYKGKLDRYIMKQKVVYAALSKPEIYLSCQTMKSVMKRCNVENATSYTDVVKSARELLTKYATPTPEFFQYIKDLGYSDIVEWIRKVDASVIE